MKLHFKELIVWQKSMTLAETVYAVSSRLPKEEQFGLVNQMRRCAISVPSNIAEGSKRSTPRDYAQFISIASGSSAELETQLLLARAIYSIDSSAALMLLAEVQSMLEKIKRTLTNT